MGTANLAALASISKAPSTSSLLATSKKLPASGVIHGSGGSKKLTPKIGSASSHLNKFSSRLFSPTKSSAAKSNFGSAQKAGPSNLLSSVTSFLPSKAKAPKPTQEEIQKKKEEELRLKKENEEKVRQRKEEEKKAKMEEKRLKNEERLRKVQLARQEQERQKAIEKE